MKKQMNAYGRNVFSLIASPITLKILAIGLLTLLLIKPAAMIQSLIHERENRQKEVVTEVNSKWGSQQTIMGPVISIPFRTGNSSIEYVHFLPETLNIVGKIRPQILYRGIFEAVVYNADLKLAGSFSYPEPEVLKIPRNDIEWENAIISLGFSDVRGIKETIVAKVNDTTMRMNPGLVTKDILSSGVSAGIVLNRRVRTYTFTFKLNLNGSERINFVPLGKSTTVSVSSQWPNPNFDGAYLPTERSVNDKEFSATWKVLDLNRNYPQYWTGTKYVKQIEQASFGVGLFTPVDFYQKSMRTTKYALLFVALIFIAIFISELVAKVRVHPVQYLLIGIAIITFYTLLLSLSEHINFGTAYAISSLAVIALVTSYAKSILKGTKLAVIVGGVLIIVYGYLYWLLQMIDYALVVGSIGLFFVISVIMYVTRKMDWYAIRVGIESGEKSLQNEMDA